MQKIDIGTEIDLADLLVSRLLIQANSGGGKSGLARKIMEKCYGIVPFIVIDYDGEYYTLKEKLSDVIVIGGHAADIPLSLQAARLLPREIISNQLSVVIDPSEMKMKGRIEYVKIFLETMMELPKTLWKPYFVFIEEAHKYCGEQDKQESGPAVRDLMSGGRKMGYCGILLTQRISKLHKDAAAECNNKFVGRTNLDIDMDRAARELGFTSSSQYTRLSLRGLQPRHFYCYGTSIQPHHVHEVTIGLCETTIPKFGMALDIKPKKPTDKVMAALSKLSLLPKDAEKELKDIASLQVEVKRLTGELAKTKKAPAAAAPTYPHFNEKQVQMAVDRAADKARADTTDHFKKLIQEGNKKIKELTDVIHELNNRMGRISKLAVPLTISAIPTPAGETIPSKREPIRAKNEPKSEKPVPKPDKNVPDGDKLGKCARAILSFLAGFDNRKFTKVQISVATGYSVNSSTFQNALSELNTRGLIVRGDRITYNQEAWQEILSLVGPVFEHKFNAHTFSTNLGKCEKELYEVILATPDQLLSKDEIAARTATGYSVNSSTFQNALSRLSTLELIEREAGKIRFNPELLELL
ncbi:MAG TPA: DUF87 domain-containing protein [Puia sp.]|jgi:hypothetical protein|nr:DUF87 domain-containing protein [Puia sp.]